MLNITKGNVVPMHAILMIDDEIFPVINAENVEVYIQGVFQRYECIHHVEESEDNVVYLEAPDTLPTGVYGVEVKGKMNDVPWRTYTKDVLKITYATEKGDNEPVVPSSDTYDITMEVQLYKTASSDKKIDEKIAEHNEDQEAHPYIRGLISQKQDVIPDLATIRSGAEKGATAYQKPAEGIPVNDLDDYAQEGISKGTLVYATVTDEGGVVDRVTAIEGKIPSAASSTNQLADKDFVNSSISTATATFKGTYNSVAELNQVPADANDYAFVISTDSAGNTVYNRYKYSNGSWLFEYALNNSSFTAAQWAAINSAITSGDVEKLAALPTKSQLDALLAAKQDTLTFDNLPTQNSNNPVKSGGVFTALAGKADKVVVENVSFVSSQQGQIFLLLPNKIYECTFVDYMDFAFGGMDITQKCEYCIKFDVASTIPTLSLPSEIIWAEELKLEANTHYVLLINYENGAYYGDWKAYPLT